MKILFFDDTRIYFRKNTERVYGRVKEEKILNNKEGSFGLPIVLKDGTIAPYIMYYQRCFITNEEEGPKSHRCLCLSVSDNGIDFKEYNNNLVFENRYFDNQVYPSDKMEEFMTIIKGNDGKYHFYADEFEWGTTYDIRIHSFESTDGINLVETGVGVLNPNGCEPFSSSYYNDKTDEYVFVIRPNWGERRVFITRTKDFKEFTPLEFCMQPDSLDREATEIYGMPSFNADGYFIGFPCIYETATSEWGMSNKYFNGRFRPQLAYSYDGIHYQRCMRVPFFPDNSPSSPYYGMVSPYSIVDAGDKVYIYSVCHNVEHGHFADDKSGSTRVFSLLKDRFMALESESGWANVRTRAFSLNNGEIKVNIELPYGEAKARLFDEMTGKVIEGFDFADCSTFVGDSTNWIPTWNGKRVTELGNKPISIEIKYRNGNLYSIEGDMIMFMTTMQVRRFVNDGIIPPKNIY